MRQPHESLPAFEAAIELEVRFEPVLFWLILGLHGSAAVLILMMSGFTAGSLGALVLTLLSLYVSLPICGTGFLARALSSVIWHSDGSWTLRDTRGRGWLASLGPRLLVSPSLIVLNWRTEAGWRACAVLRPGPQDSRACRQLRARLRATGIA